MAKGKGNKFNPRRRNRFSRRIGINRKSDFDGLNVRAPSRPKTAQEAPWNSIVVQRRITVSDDSAFTVNTQYIIDSLIAQLELPTTVSLTWRIRFVDVYDLAGRPFDARIYDFTRQRTGVPAPGQLATGLSVPARNGWSSTRLIFPKAVSAFANSGGSAIATWMTGSVAAPIGITSATSDLMLFRMHLLWRPLQAGGAPTGFSEHANLHHVPFAITPSKEFLPDKPTELPLEGQKRLHSSRASPMRA